MRSPSPWAASDAIVINLSPRPSPPAKPPRSTSTVTQVSDTPVIEEETPEDPFAAMDPEMAANPQPVFKMMGDKMPVLVADGTVVLARRAETDEAFRHPEIFSSNVD